MPDVYACYQCEADVPSGASECPSCDAAQNEEAYQAYKLKQRQEKLTARFRMAAIVVGVLTFGLGGGVGYVTANVMTAPTTTAEASSAQAQRLDREQLNDAFKQYVNMKLHLNVANWEATENYGVVLELTPPSRTNRSVVWEQFSPQERREVIGYLGIIYTRMLDEEDPSFDIQEHGHPPIILKYEGHQQRLAVRQQDGERRVFRSPVNP